MKSDEEILGEFLQAATPTIEELVSRALSMGQPTSRIAIVLERGSDGLLTGGCLPRIAVDAKLRSIEAIDDAARRTLLDAVAGASADEIPAVLLVHGDGFISVGVRRLSGRIATVS